MGLYQLDERLKPAGDQPVAIDKLCAGINENRPYQTLMGVTGSGKTFTMANVIARQERPAPGDQPQQTLAAQLYEEFKELFPNNAVEYFVSYYDYYQPEAYIPQRDIYIEKDASRNARTLTVCVSRPQRVCRVGAIASWSLPFRASFGLRFAWEDYKASAWWRFRTWR